MSYKGFPVNAYFFDVRVGSLELGFQSISGIKATAKYANEGEEEAEGGSQENTNKQLEKMEYGAVTFKKGLVKGHSMAIDVFEEFNIQFAGPSGVQGTPIEYKDIQITLKAEDDTPLFGWYLLKAYPESWEISAFDAMKNELSIETVTFNYQRLRIEQF